MELSLEKKKRYGKFLTWMGVLSWAPYLVLLALRQSPPFIPFLVVHLTGVLGGLYMKRSKPSNQDPNKRLRMISTWLIVFGVSMWGMYYILKLTINSEISVLPFLVLHLLGVVSGVGVKLWIFMRE